ncbi:protein SRC2 homolog [Fagus crenata]
MASSRPSLPKPLDLELTIVSAKHLKNVNWKNGDLKPYAVFWVDPDRRLATKSDEAGSTRPVWNERFTLPLSLPLQDSFLTLEIFHSKPSETPKPLVGTLRVPLRDLDSHEDDPTRIRTFELTRPSGRPQGKIRVKLGFRERPLPPPPDYHLAPPPSYFYPCGPPTARDYRGYSPSPYTSPLPAPSPSPSPPPPPSYSYSSYPDAYSGYYTGYYSSAPPPPLPPRPFFDRPVNYGSGGPSGPSAPVDYSPYDQKPKSSKVGLGTGLAVGAVAGALGGLALEEGMKYEEEKIAERVENDLAARDDYSDYRSDYRADY